jgi:hypothetical protein
VEEMKELDVEENLVWVRRAVSEGWKAATPPE